MKNFNPIRGTEDYLPRQARMREIVRQRILENYQNNGYNLIETPILESLDYLNSSEGGDNLRLMFKTVKRGDKLNLTKPNLTEADITEEGLRYDLTVPLSRFYSNNKDKLPTPFKSIQIGYSFRAERPQRGRSRQFIQCDVDVFGDASINAELELLNTCLDTYKKLGFNDLTLKINNRKILNDLVLCAGFEEKDLNTICVTLDKLDKIAMTGVIMELIEKGFDTININKLAEIIGTVCEKGIESLAEFNVDMQSVDELKYLIDALKQLHKDVVIKYDTSIVRGQGYYTGTVYEMYAQGFGGAIGGGGRYDKMIKKITGVDVPAVGFSIGFEPVTMLLLERKQSFDEKQNLALIYDQDNDILNVFKVKEELKKLYNVSLYLRPKNMRAFYEKIGEVAECVTSVNDYQEGKEIKHLT